MLLTVIRDEIKAGNIYIGDSKRFGRFDDFFIPDTQWQTMRSNFFKRAGLPEKEADVPDYLTERLNKAYDDFLAQLPENTYANLDEGGWQLSVDQAEKLDSTAKGKLDDLNQWLSDELRVIKLPELLSGAILSWADLGGADLSGADLAGANLEGAYLRRAKHDKDTIWPENIADITVKA